ncbi:MAG: hypothetical protein FJ306_06585 [Planctomycetes bacterium]|nr:hypothetical protein [Planctomycetota bacterium]
MRPLRRVAAAAALLPLAFAACLPLPPVGKQIAHDLDVSLVRVRDDAPGSPTVTTTATTDGATFVAVGAPMAAIVAHLWPGQEVERANDLPTGRYDAMIEGESSANVRALLARAVAAGLRATLHEETRTTMEHRLVALPETTVQPATKDGAYAQEFRFQRDGDLRTLTFRGSTQSFLDLLPTMLPGVVVRGATEADTLLAVAGEFRDVDGLRALLAGEGFDVAPEPLVRAVLRVERAAGGE